MRPDGPVKDLTDAQKLMARTAGVPADRPGLGAEYPKMVFRKGSNMRHQLENKPIPMGNGPQVRPERDAPLTEGYQSEVAYVDSPEDEAEALASGWYLSLTPEGQAKEAERHAKDAAKDLEIAELRAQLAQGEQRRGPGRPPKDA